MNDKVVFSRTSYHLSFDDKCRCNCDTTLRHNKAVMKIFIDFFPTHTNTIRIQLSSIPWRAIMTSKPVYAIIVANFARSWTFYLLLQNQLTYMREALGMKINDVSEEIISLLLFIYSFISFIYFNNDGIHFLHLCSFFRRFPCSYIGEGGRGEGVERGEGRGEGDVSIFLIYSIIANVFDILRLFHLNYLILED